MQSTFLTVHRISYFVNSCILSITLQNSNSDKMMDDNTPFIAEVLDINDNAKQSSTTSAIALENAEAKCDDEVDANSSSSTPLIDRKRRDNIKRNQERFKELGLEDATKEMNKVAMELATTMELAELRAELATVKSELAEVRAELATVKANQSHFDDFAQRNEHRIELDQSQCIHHMKEVELRAELATVKANQSHIRAQLTEHSATLNEQAEIRAEHAELIAALAEIRADHGQILRSSAQLRAEPVEEIAELKAAIKEILTTLKEMVSFS